jgi:dTDP-glucose 4,6-dehydratase
MKIEIKSSHGKDYKVTETGTFYSTETPDALIEVLERIRTNRLRCKFYYGDIETGFHVETDLLKPSNPYSATKAAADMLVLAFARTFNIPYIILRPTNNYGIGQYVEKLIPKTVKYMELGRRVDLHDKGTPRRTWLHISDTAEAVLTVIKSGVQNDIYNISGNYEDSNLHVVQKIFYQFGITDYQDHITDLVRPGQDVRYAIDDSKLRALGWAPVADFDEELARIVNWYRANFVW